MTTPTGHQDIEVPTPEVDREIYVMPAFTTLSVTELGQATRWYRHLGFEVLAEMGDGPGRLVHLRRYRYQDLLLVLRGPAEDAPTGARSWTSFSHTGPLEELEAMAAALRTDGTGSVKGPEAMPWHAIELRATDADGHTVVLTAAPTELPDPSVLEELGLRMPER